MSSQGMSRQGMGTGHCQAAAEVGAQRDERHGRDRWAAGTVIMGCDPP